jgi:adhesin/invasin
LGDGRRSLRHASGLRLGGTGSRLGILLALAVGLFAFAAQPALASHDQSKIKIQLMPGAAMNTAGTQHCVTARVRDVGHGSAAVVGATVRFSVTGANSASGVGVTDVNGEATFCYVGTKTGNDLISAFVDFDNDGTRDNNEPLATATKTWTPGQPATLTLLPATATNTVGTQHCVTATVRDALGNPVPGKTVVFKVTGPNSASGAKTTDVNGQAQFCYTGTNAGGDLITAFADTNGSGVQDPGEPSGTANKTYVPAGPNTLTLMPAASTNTVGTQHCVTATATDAFGNPSSGVTVIFTVTGANSASGSATTNASGQAQFCYTGTTAGLDTIKAFADTDKSGTQGAGEPFAVATKTWTPGGPALITLTPATATNVVGVQHCVIATVTDAFGNRVPNVSVVFSVTGANPQPATTKTTDQNGNATFCYTGTKAGEDLIEAFADSNGDGQQQFGEPFATATKTYTPAAAATVVLTPATATNTVGTQHCVTATVRDAFANPTPNVTVFFSVSGANSASGTATTDANGQAQFCYTGTKAGEDTIEAVADANANNKADLGEPTGLATKTYKPGPPASLSLAPKTATNEAGQQHCVTATVTDQFGNATPGIAVRFSVSGANPQPETPQVTDANGKATFCYVGTKAGNDTIAAFADTNANGSQDNGEPGDTATKTYKPGPPATLTLTPKAADNPVNTQHCVTATVKDEFGNPTPGISVVFTVSGASATGGTKTTDSNGQAQFCYLGPKLVGADVIKAFADTNKNGTQDATTVPPEPSDQAAKAWVAGPPATLTLAPKTATNEAGQQHCVTATVRDEFGNPTPNISVVFSVSGANPQTPVTKTTDANGQATFCYTGTKAGEDLIKAFADTNKNGVQDATTVPPEPSDTATKTYKPGPPASLSLAPKTATNEAGQQHCVTATVTDQFGNATPGIAVRFSVSGANSQPETPQVTDANGKATFCYVGTKAGNDTIAAFADTNANGSQDNGEPGDTATKTYKPGQPATLTLSPKTATNPVDSKHCVTATVTDAFGNATPGVTVVFSVTGSINTSGLATTNAGGQADFCYTGPPLPGEDVIKAFADTNKNGTQDATTVPPEPSDAATKTWTVPPSTPGCEVIVTQGGAGTTLPLGDKATFGGNAKVGVGTPPAGQEEYQDHGPAAPMNLHSISLVSIICSPDRTYATIFGKATVDGSGSFDFRIDVTDLAEPGVGKDTYSIIVSTGYTSGVMVLEGGNVQIH